MKITFKKMVITSTLVLTTSTAVSPVMAASNSEVGASSQVSASSQNKGSDEKSRYKEQVRPFVQKYNEQEIWKLSQYERVKKTVSLLEEYDFQSNPYFKEDLESAIKQAKAFFSVHKDEKSGQQIIDEEQAFYGELAKARAEFDKKYEMWKPRPSNDEETKKFVEHLEKSEITDEKKTEIIAQFMKYGSPDEEKWGEIDKFRGRYFDRPENKERPDKDLFKDKEYMEEYIKNNKHRWKDSQEAMIREYVQTERKCLEEEEKRSQKLRGMQGTELWTFEIVFRSFLGSNGWFKIKDEGSIMDENELDKRLRAGEKFD